jgi:tripartite-type tricarboxylate transporter receptor subunit TctC
MASSDDVLQLRPCYRRAVNKKLLHRCAGAALAIAAMTGSAQQYPARPVNVVTSGAPFGLTDISARLVALNITDTLGVEVAVQNRVDAGGTAAAALVARAAPDGYTLLVSDGTHAANAYLVRNSGYEPLGDFAPVSLLARAPLVLVVNSHVPARTVAELVQLARARPGLVTFAMTDPGSPARLLMEMLKLDARMNVTSVPYPDAGPALTDVAGGRTDAVFTLVPQAGDHVASGRIRALAVASEAPSPALPGVPLMKDAYPAFVAYFWVGMLAPAKTPDAIVARLNADVVRVLRSEELRSRFGNLGLETVGSTRGEFDQFLKREIERWGRVVREGKIRD